ncbi:P-loop containing nucleoside triphosphate hydrolase [Vibrio phage 2.275.O._10N.286.54.E11]|nr:P-loop containing nucleoside triphosphate hydrolase [Vibrio phage 2.275.O._10N.286.54.E11]
MSKYAAITNGVSGLKNINGVFKMHSAPDMDDEGMITIMLSNLEYRTPIKVQVDFEDLEVVEEGYKAGYSESEVAEIIRDRFAVFSDMTEALLDEESGINSLVVTGATGVGKTYNLEKRLKAAEKEIGQCFDIVGGKATPTGLYMALFRNRFPGQVLVLDDCNVFDKEDSVDMLKNALDSSEERWVSNLSMSKDLKDQGVPNKFKFEGKVVFLSNINFMQQIDRQTKIAPHLAAFVGRSTFIDLMIHDTRSIMLHVENVVRSSDMFEKMGLSESHMEDAIGFLKENVEELNKLSIRTPLEIAKLMRLGNNWKRTAQVTQLRPRQIIWAD